MSLERIKWNGSRKKLEKEAGSMTVKIAEDTKKIIAAFSAVKYSHASVHR
jgi:hypothetical protein